MQGAGSALMGIGSSRGDDRAVQAAELAISSPLLEASIDGAHGVLLSIQGGSDLGLFEINEAARLVQEAAHPEANIIFGAVIDDALGDEVRVTVIAAGFDGGAPLKRENERAIGQIQGASRPAQQAQPNSHAAAPAAPAPTQLPPQQPVSRPVPEQPVPAQQQAPARPREDDPVTTSQPHQTQPAAPREPVGRPPRTVTFDEGDDLDVPDFLK
ncbi:MAG TPA: cell division protein FtsZ, partial [Pedococcus sp.]|nr:cell division protein FtsZ [Pedococcus sp.]